MQRCRSLILADGAKLTATATLKDKAGIQVSGDDNSLTIYGQACQTGQLIASGGQETGGTNDYDAAGIGGGHNGSGSNITINGGNVTANSLTYGAGIGNGKYNPGNTTAASNIFVATALTVKADGCNPPMTELENTGNDLAGSLKGKQYVSIAKSLPVYKAEAIAAISAAVEGVTDEGILAIANKAIEDINAATSVEDVTSIKEKALADIALAKAKIAAIAEINAAIEGLTLFQAEQNHIDFMIDDIRNEDDENSVNLTKQTTLEYIALHPAKLAAIAEVKTAMGDLAESVITYNYIGCLAIESAYDANSIAMEKDNAIAKLDEVKTLLDDVYAIGKAAGIEEGKAEGLVTLGTEQPGPAVKVTKGDNEVILYSPDKVEYIINKSGD